MSDKNDALYQKIIKILKDRLWSLVKAILKNLIFAKDTKPLLGNEPTEFVRWGQKSDGSWGFIDSDFGIPKVLVRLDVNNVLIQDKSVLRDKGDTFVNGWITFDEFKCAVKNGRLDNAI